ncbi:DUF296 domain-containing protein [Rhizobium sp. FKY42]|uniref:PCC domain-containing protein n=1 Tax=Rhizobium sp. FKY42 TaxID=2562310 RepID=UPI0010C07692|nr:DUF296 domain-containing protein [Rhizobium sp. FKY42]
MTVTEEPALPRHIVHPGSVTPERVRAVVCHVQPVRISLKTGCTINEAIAQGFAQQGFEGGYVRLTQVPMRTLNYVMPAAAPDESHAAWYSETYAMPGGVILDAALHAGRREDKPFLHCHGAWQDTEGRIEMGHLLPFEAELLEETIVDAVAISGALFVTRHDTETNFSLFNPEKRPDAVTAEASASRAILATVRPNTDLCRAVEEICRAFDIRDAQVHGLGSLVGVDYEDGTTLTAHASELYIRNGTVTQQNGTGHAALDIAMVDLTGRHSRGLLKRGLNPVCVTAEILIVESKPAV